MQTVVYANAPVAHFLREYKSAPNGTMAMTTTTTKNR